jgi:dihydrofolate reductase
VVTRDPAWRAEGVEVAHTVASALELAGSGPVFVVGGGELYRQTIDRAHVLELTEVDQYLEGDVFFPPLDRTAWVEVAREARDGYAFVRYERAGRPSAGQAS